jgi:hypothetical protein
MTDNNRILKKPVSKAGGSEGAGAYLVGRLMYYFSTYKLRPASAGSVAGGDPYDRSHAEAVVAASLEDYRGRFGR